jgi:energy-coupling factor transporter ATP-binding protein EcfA2
MKLLNLSIEGFRGIRKTSVTFSDHTVVVGPNGSGKSTIIDALSLLFGRTKLVRELTEHDFLGSCPTETSRIRIVGTLGGFGDDPDDHMDWFREGRAVPKWWSDMDCTAHPEQSEEANQLCAQIAWAARFDLEELVVEQRRYFHDDDDQADVFDEDIVQQIPTRLLHEIGYFVLPARRTWEATISFASELFRKAVTTLGGVPATTILEQRDRLRSPSSPLEEEAELKPLVARINDQLSQLLPEAPKLQMRLTSTDSASYLRALVPHYQVEAGVSLPAGRHGTGLLSLQTLLLLLEIGRERKKQKLPFILAMEEPELHVPPGLQRRLVAEAMAIAEQTICTSHAPRIASFYPATAVQLLEKREPHLAATPMLGKPLDSEATQPERKLANEDRGRYIEALMQVRVLIPEGKTEHEWFRLLGEQVETHLSSPGGSTPPFGLVIGVAPTHSSAVAETYQLLRPMRSGLVPFVDGDTEGDDKIGRLLAAEPPPEVVLQLPNDQTIEDVIEWILSGASDDILGELKSRVDREFESVEELVQLLKIKKGKGRLKGDFLAYEEIAAAIGSDTGCRSRARTVLDAITLASLGRQSDSGAWREDARSTDRTVVLKLST